MNSIAILTITILIIMALFHFYWAFGGKLGLDKALPTHEGIQLLNPSRALTFFVGIILVGFAYIAYALHFYDFTLQDKTLYQYSGIFLAILFTLRAIGEFNMVGFFKKIHDTPFAKYDTLLFSPLCLVLGVIFGLLSYTIS